jgi:hypothetical protein
MLIVEHDYEEYYEAVQEGLWYVVILADLEAERKPCFHKSHVAS